MSTREKSNQYVTDSANWRCGLARLNIPPPDSSTSHPLMPVSMLASDPGIPKTAVSATAGSTLAEPDAFAFPKARRTNGLSSEILPERAELSPISVTVWGALPL